MLLDCLNYLSQFAHDFFSDYARAEDDRRGLSWPTCFEPVGAAATVMPRQAGCLSAMTGETPVFRRLQFILFLKLNRKVRPRQRRDDVSRQLRRFVVCACFG